MSFLNNLKSAGATGRTAVRLNLSEEDEPTSPPPARDLLVFPDMVKLLGAYIAVFGEH